MQPPLAGAYQAPLPHGPVPTASPFGAHAPVHGVMLPAPATNAAATTGLVLGLVSMPLSALAPIFVGACCLLSLPLALIGVSFSHFGWSQSQATGIGRTPAMLGLWFNWLQLGAALLLVTFFLIAVLLENLG